MIERINKACLEDYATNGTLLVDLRLKVLETIDVVNALVLAANNAETRSAAARAILDSGKSSEDKNSFRDTEGGPSKRGVSGMVSPTGQNYTPLSDSSNTSSRTKTNTSECKTCNGTGQVQSRSIGWEACPDCGQAETPSSKTIIQANESGLGKMLWLMIEARPKSQASFSTNTLEVMPDECVFSVCSGLHGGTVIVAAIRKKKGTE